MPIIIDPAAEAQTKATSTRSVLLFEFYLTAGTQYFTTCDRVLIYSGHSYMPFPLQIGEIKKSAMGLTDDVTVVLSNVSRDIAALMVAETFRGKRAVIYRVFLSDDYTITTPFIVFDGLVDEVTGKEDKESSVIVATLTTDLAYWQKSLPCRQYQATCSWAFKSTGCAYVGAETWCNKTWERCKALVNQPRYAGFRHLPKIESTPIWWGKVAPVSTPGVGAPHVGVQIWR